MIHQIRTIGSRLKHRDAIRRNRRLESERKMWEARLEMMKIESAAQREALNRRIKAAKDHQEKLISRLPIAKHEPARINWFVVIGSLVGMVTSILWIYFFK